MTNLDNAQQDVVPKHRLLLASIQAIGVTDYRNPEIQGKTNKMLEDAADCIDVANDLDNADIIIRDIARQCARLNVGDTVTGKLIEIIVRERKAGGGTTKVKKVFDTEVAKALKAAGIDTGAEWKLAYDGMVQEMNESHANVIYGGKNYVARFATSEITGKKQIEYVQPKELAGLYLHDEYTIGIKETGAKDNRNKIDAWLRHPQHRQYLNGVYFLPVRPNGDKQPREKALNLWDGMASEPAKGGSWDKIDYHVKHVLAAGDNDVYQYLLNWCAYTIQYPNRQAGAAIVFRGKKRIGKGIFANWLTELWGNHGVMINNGKHLTGQFNGHLEQTCLLFLDEALYAGDRKHESMLKSLITEPTYIVERKHHDGRPVPNYLKIMMATNDDWAIPTSIDDARFCVCDVSDKHKGDDNYFKELRAQMDAESSKSAFIADMLERDLSGYLTSHIPLTAGLRDQIRLSLDGVWLWWMDVLDRGYVSGDDTAPWDSMPKSSDLYASYIAWCDQAKKGEWGRVTSTKFGKTFSEVYHKKATAIARCYVVGDIDSAKIEFERTKIGLPANHDASLSDDDFSDVPF